MRGYQYQSAALLLVFCAYGLLDSKFSSTSNDQRPLDQNMTNDSWKLSPAMLLLTLLRFTEHTQNATNNAIGHFRPKNVVELRSIVRQVFRNLTHTRFDAEDHVIDEVLHSFAKNNPVISQILDSDNTEAITQSSGEKSTLDKTTTKRKDNGANSLDSEDSPTSTTLNSTLNSTTAPSTTSPSTTSSTTLSTKSTTTTSTTTSTTSEPTTTVTTTAPKEIQWTLKDCTISPKNGKTIEEIKTNWLKELKNCIETLNNTERTNSSVALVEVDDESMQCMAHQRYAAEFINQTIRQNYTVGNENMFLVFNFKSKEELMAIDNVGYIDSVSEIIGTAISKYYEQPVARLVFVPVRLKGSGDVANEQQAALFARMNLDVKEKPKHSNAALFALGPTIELEKDPDNKITFSASRWRQVTLPGNAVTVFSGKRNDLEKFADQVRKNAEIMLSISDRRYIFLVDDQSKFDDARAHEMNAAVLYKHEIEERGKKIHEISDNREKIQSTINRYFQTNKKPFYMVQSYVPFLQLEYHGHEEKGAQKCNSSLNSKQCAGMTWATPTAISVKWKLYALIVTTIVSFLACLVAVVYAFMVIKGVRDSKERHKRIIDPKKIQFDREAPANDNNMTRNADRSEIENNEKPTGFFAKLKRKLQSKRKTKRLPLKDVRTGTMDSLPVFFQSLKVTVSKARFSAFVRRDLEAMCSTRHKNVLAIYGVTLPEPGVTLLVTEFCFYSSLRELLNLTAIDPFCQVTILLDIARGMEYVHSKDNLKFHGSLSSLVCMVDACLHVKVKIDHSKEFQTIGHMTEISGDRQYRAMVWKAPELLQPSPSQPNQKCDAYSFGIIMHEVVVQEGPFGIFSHDSDSILDLDPAQVERSTKKEAAAKPLDVEQFREAWCYERFVMNVLPSIIHPTVPITRPNVSNDDCSSKDLIDLMQACWAEKPAKRPSFKVVRRRLTMVAHELGYEQNLENTNRRMQAFIEDWKTEAHVQNEKLRRVYINREELCKKMFPQDVVPLLLQNIKLTPQRIDCVTTYSNDMKGFTVMCSKSSAKDVIEILNYLFTEYDRIADMYEIYPLKPVGDAYFMIGGAPVHNSRHAQDIAQCALQIREVVKKYNETSKKGMQITIRAGVATASVWTHVLRQSTGPTFMIFGDAEMESERMEKLGDVHRVRISESTNILLSDEARKKGGIPFVIRREENKDGSVAYWLEGVKPWVEQGPYPLTERLDADAMTTASPSLHSRSRHISTSTVGNLVAGFIMSDRARHRQMRQDRAAKARNKENTSTMSFLDPTIVQESTMNNFNAENPVVDWWIKGTTTVRGEPTSLNETMAEESKATSSQTQAVVRASSKPSKPNITTKPSKPNLTTKPSNQQMSSKPQLTMKPSKPQLVNQTTSVATVLSKSSTPKASKTNLLPGSNRKNRQSAPSIRDILQSEGKAAKERKSKRAGVKKKNAVRQIGVIKPKKTPKPVEITKIKSKEIKNSVSMKTIDTNKKKK